MGEKNNKELANTLDKLKNEKPIDKKGKPSESSKRNLKSCLFAFLIVAGLFFVLYLYILYLGFFTDTFDWIS